MDGIKISDVICLRDEEWFEWDFMETSKGMGRRFEFSSLNVTGEFLSVLNPTS